MKVTIEDDGALTTIEGEPEEVASTLRILKSRRLRPRSLSDNETSSAFDSSWPWFKDRPQLAVKTMRELGLKSPTDELRCPKCGLMLKPEGEFLGYKDSSKYSAHVGNAYCLTRKELGELSTGDIQRLKKQELKVQMEANSVSRPKCACGCGIPVEYDVGKKRWFKFYDGHNSTTPIKRDKLHRYFAELKDGEYQDDFWRRMGLSNRDASRVIRRLVVERLIEREPRLHNGRRTFILRKRPPKSVAPTPEAVAK